MVAGAIIGFLITTGILVWGLSLYEDGGAIAFFGIEVPQPLFLILCVVWYVFDVVGLVQARKQRAAAVAAPAKEALQDDTVGAPPPSV